jgi:hypothetical protein
VNTDEDVWRRLAAQLHEAAEVAGQLAAERECVFAMATALDEGQELCADARSASGGSDHE